MKPLESSVENRVVRWANYHGVLHTKLNLQGRRGWPDRVFWIPGGAPLLVEFKRPGSKPRPLQRHIHIQLKESGYDVRTCSNAEEAIGWLRYYQDIGS